MYKGRENIQGEETCIGGGMCKGRENIQGEETCIRGGGINKGRIILIYKGRNV